MKVAVYDKTGKKSASVVDTKIFDGKANQTLLAEAIYIYSSNKRQAPASTLDRSEVSGGGKKPWRQKGTGRARAGSSRSPIWRSGGVTFGPRPEQHYKLNMPKKKKDAALSAALASKKAEDILVIKEVKMEKPSTKALSDLFKKLDLDRNILIISEKDDINLYKSARNLKCGVKTYDYKKMNAYDVLWAKKIVFLGDSLSLAGGKK
ncbi:50S ribosomal protein L4 [candidate division WS5 bacterium]|uniref:Large ribosomal subunit protein uL4 n=1 Tax=candidate division WS5 bacterium TaxID=2093353 RepID=A0A419DAB5_9BACT|nr:MAG: 50S ribosomal protein L4 [candidate division WS5 bacterium]